MNSTSGSKETNIEDLRSQVKKQLARELGESSAQSREYVQFRKDNLPAHYSLYERCAKAFGSVVSIAAGKDAEVIQKDLDTAHLHCSPSDVLSLALFAPFIVFFTSLVFTVVVPVIFGNALSFYFFLFSIIMGFLTYVPLRNMPSFLAQRHRQLASNQMVLCIFYIVTFMRHTPNLELALEFAAEHIGAPLSFDLKKVLWDVETQKYRSVSESLDMYLIQWREDAREFIESLHLIMSSLYETSNDRRITSLDKSLEVMLEETYEKMLHFAQNLKSPMTMLHMLGIVLPVLGLVILPLAVSFFDTHWTVIASMYNILLPAGVFYLGKKILSMRPTGYGQTEASPIADTASFSSLRFNALLIFFFLFFIGISPLLIHLLSPGFDVDIGTFSLLGYVDVDGVLRGPFGLGAGILSLAVTLSFGLGAGYFFYGRAKNLIQMRNRTKQLELEFASALFQLGNRIGDGVPVELAFGRVAEVMDGTHAGAFFHKVAVNIQRLGMGVEEALFHEKHGIVREFPSNLIESSMKVLVESAKKGPQEASKALMSMSNYIKEMHRVDERLKDLLSDVLSSMKSQVNFLLPTIAGIVIGITSMITTVLGALQAQSDEFSGVGGAGATVPGMDFGLGIPTFYFQIIIGLYVVQVTYILSYMINGVENGVDPVSEDWIRGKGLLLATTLYVCISFAIILVFNVIAGQIITVG